MNIARPDGRNQSCQTSVVSCQQKRKHRHTEPLGSARDNSVEVSVLGLTH
jgi:hypothetical protein